MMRDLQAHQCSLSLDRPSVGAIRDFRDTTANLERKRWQVFVKMSRNPSHSVTLIP